jgi:hypothetical protein
VTALTAARQRIVFGARRCRDPTPAPSGGRRPRRAAVGHPTAPSSSIPTSAPSGAATTGSFQHPNEITGVGNRISTPSCGHFAPIAVPRTAIRVRAARALHHRRSTLLLKWAACRPDGGFSNLIGQSARSPGCGLLFAGAVESYPSRRVLSIAESQTDTCTHSPMVKVTSNDRDQAASQITGTRPARQWPGPFSGPRSRCFDRPRPSGRCCGLRE